MDAVWNFLKSYLTLPVLLSVLRSGMKAVGTLLVGKGFVDAAGVETAIGAILALVGVIWSAAEAKKNAKLKAATASTDGPQ